MFPNLHRRLFCSAASILFPKDEMQADSGRRWGEFPYSPLTEATAASFCFHEVIFQTGACVQNLKIACGSAFVDVVVGNLLNSKYFSTETRQRLTSEITGK